MGSGKLINAAYKKYGISNFQKTILKFYESRRELMNAERLIVNEELVNSRLFYNQAIGGGGGGFYGKTHAESFKKKISSIHKNKILNCETKKKISNSRKILGLTTKHSQETKLKIAAKNSGKTHPRYDSRPVTAIDQTGKLVQFESKFEASKKLNVKGSSNISKALKTGKTAYGYKWYYTSIN